MRKAFTMIEIIFVIVIIGVLASVAIPKLQSLRDNATASTCVHEVGQFINELTQRYGSSKTFASWQAFKLEDNITNITLDSHLAFRLLAPKNASTVLKALKKRGVPEKERGLTGPMVINEY